MPFYGFNRPGANVSQRIRDNWWRQGMMGGIKAQRFAIIAPARGSLGQKKGHWPSWIFRVCVVSGSATCGKVGGMGSSYIPANIDDYLRKRLMPVEGAIPQLPGIEMYGNSVPAEVVGGDLFEYINFQQRYDIEVRIQLALKRSQEYLQNLAVGASPAIPLTTMSTGSVRVRTSVRKEKPLTGEREARNRCVLPRICANCAAPPALFSSTPKVTES